MKKKKLLASGAILLAILCIACIITTLWLERKPEIPDADIPVQPTKTAEIFTTSSKYKSPIDFDALKEESSDIIAWLEIDGTDISYPVLFREGDNSYYLRRDIYGKYDKNGSLFIEDYNKTDFNDPVTIIYGHHMSSGAMFGKLQEIYTNPETFSKHSKITVYMPEKELIYRAFCAVPLDNSHILYYHDFNNRLIFEEYFKEVFETRSLLAVFDESISVTPDDKVLMLSTCFETDYSRRYVVMAVCEDELK